MTFDQVSAMIGGIGLPYAYDHFPKRSAPGGPPFICYLFTGSRNFAADGVVYQRIEELRVELYTDVKDPALEERVEAALTAAGIVFERDEDYIEAERMHMTVYTSEILFDRQEV